MAKASFLVSCCEGRSEHSLSYAQWENCRGSALVPLSAGVLDDIGAFGVCPVVKKVGLDSFMSLVALRVSTEAEW